MLYQTNRIHFFVFLYFNTCFFSIFLTISDSKVTNTIKKRFYLSLHVLWLGQVNMVEGVIGQDVPNQRFEAIGINVS